MPESTSGDVLRFLQKACALHGTCDLTDHQLLERFLLNRDEGAFTFLVRRHGPVILRACQRLLGDRHDAEDALQTAFLVLVRQSRSIRQKESVGSWLYGVARHVALKTRTRDAARRKRERKAGAERASGSKDDVATRELRSVLDEEIGSLPEKYRGPVLLCCLEGKSYDKAARELGCPKSSLESRLNKAFELLRCKLKRRGVTLALGALATTLGDMAAAAPLPATLTIKTVKAATLVVAGRAAVGGCISAHVLALAGEAIKGMFWVKVKTFLLLVGLGLAVGGAGWAVKGRLVETGQRGQKVIGQAPAPKKQAENRPTNEKITAGDELGDPLPEGAVVRFETHPFRHEGSVGGRTGTGLLFTPDGKTLVGSTEGGVILWNADTGQERKRLPMRMATEEQGMALSPDGISLAVADKHPDDLTPKIAFWNLQKGTISKSLSLPEGDSRFAQEIFFLCFSPDGKSLACNNEGKAVIFDIASGKITATLGNKDSPLHFPLVFSPDGKLLAATVELDSSVQIWDITAGRMIRRIQETPGQNKRQSIRALAYAPNGNTLAFANSKYILLIDPATGKELGRFEGKLGTYSFNLAFTNDSKKLVSGPDFSGKLQVWDVATGRILQDLKSRSGNGYRSMALSPDGKTVRSTPEAFLSRLGGKLCNFGT